MKTVRTAALLTIVTLASVVTGGATITRIDQTSPAVTYSGAWEMANTDRAWSGGTAAVSTQALARATFTFTGTRVSWIGFRGPQAGKARVFLDGSLKGTVDAFAWTEQLDVQLFTSATLADGAHTLVIEVTGGKNFFASANYIVVDAFEVTSSGTTTTTGTFAPGDLFVSLENGPVQWRRSDGTLVKTLIGLVPGTGEGIGFDSAGNLYVTRWRTSLVPGNGNTTEVFDVRGQPAGTFGTGYDCDPHAIVFDSAGTAYVGQAGCTGAILKFVPGQSPVVLPVAPDNAGSFWVDLAADGCTIYYTSWGPNVKRFDGCRGVQLADFNLAPLPGGETHDLRVLPDGGVLVTSGDRIARLDSIGRLVQTYSVPGEYSPWTGVDMVGDGTFWAGNYESSNVYRFDLTTGAVVSRFNTGTPTHTVVDVAIKK